ncbi:MAG: hypothetical protein M3492_10805 [Actinomycetota bacterium]|nr:hypothetical protein [Actinomycetota bacterium]
MEISRKWQVITVGAALTGVGLTGVALADTSTPVSEGGKIAPISVNAYEDTSPESADSPNQSANDSPPPAPAPAPAPQPGNGGGGGGDDSASAGSAASAASADSAD